MRVSGIIAALVFLFLINPVVATSGDFDFLLEMDRKARADLKDFAEHLSEVSGLPVPRIDAIIDLVDKPADAFMVIKIGALSNRPVEEVLHVYESNKRNGWGAIAKQMGIKPGSKEFHELKKGNGYPSDASRGKGKVKDKENSSKGKNK